MTTVEFEIAGLNDALKRAAKIAPTKGRKLETYAGLMFEVIPETEEENATVILRATNGDVFYREWLMPDAIEGDAVDWRLPSMLVANVVASLPQSKRVIFTDTADKARLEIKCGKLKATCRKIPPQHYPDWDYIDTEQLTHVTGFGERLEQVGWCVGDTPPLNGIHVTGEEMAATNRYRLARTPMPIDGLAEPITVPASVLAPIMKHVVDTKLGVVGNHLCMMPNDQIEIMCTIFDEDYPNIERITNATFTDMVMFDKVTMKNLIERVTSAGSTDRQISLEFLIGDQGVELQLLDEEHQVFDAMPIEGQCDHPVVHYKFTPQNFTDAVSKAPGEMIMFHYTKDKPTALVKFESSDNYEVWVAPRVGAGSGEDQ